MRKFLLFILALGVAINLLLLVPALYTLAIFDRVFTSRHLETLWALTLIAVVCLGLMSVMDAARGRLLQWAGAEMDRLLGPTLMRVQLRSAAVGTLNPSMAPTRDIALVRGVLAGPSLVALLDLVWIPIFVGVIFLFHPWLGTVTLVSVFSLITVTVLLERSQRHAGNQVLAQGRSLADQAEAMTRHAQVVQGMGMLDALVDRYSAQAQDLSAKLLGLGRNAAVLTALSKFLRQFTQVMVYLVGAYLVIVQNESPGVMIASTLLLGRALAPVESLAATWRQTSEAIGAARRLDLALADGGQVERAQLPAPDARLQFESVAWAPPGGSRPVIADVHMTCQPGTITAVAGASGSGKSTLLRVAMGILEPVHGRVILGSTPTSTWDSTQLARWVGYVAQDTAIFPGTLLENLCGFEQATAPLIETISRVSDELGFSEVIKRLPDGLETHVGAPGDVPLSAGQLQVLCVVRAMAKSPRILVLDEPTSNLDPVLIGRFMQKLANLKKAGVCIVLATHQTQLFNLAEQLLVLEQGRTKALGPTAAVLERLRLEAEGRQRAQGAQSLEKVGS